MNKYEAAQGTLSLLNVLVLNDSDLSDKSIENIDNVSLNLVKRGIILDESFYYIEDYALFKSIVDYLIRSHSFNREMINSTMYKSFNAVEESSRGRLVFKQLLHYLTGYSEGESTVEYEEQTIPVKFIKTIKIDTFKEKVLTALQSKVAGNTSFIENVMVLVKYYNIEFTQEELNSINNKEALAWVHYFNDTYPEEPVEFLRYIIFLVSKRSLLIKNDETYRTIKDFCDEYEQQRNSSIKGEIDNRYERLVNDFKQFDKIKLASIFNRFKPIFLSLKNVQEIKYDINKISRLSKTHHIPYKQPILSELTTFKHNIDVVKKEIKVATTGQLIRAFNSLRYLSLTLDSANKPLKIYNIRNGKRYAEKAPNRTLKEKEYKLMQKYSEALLKEIAMRVHKNVDGRDVLLDPSIDYTLVPSMKKLIGNKIPEYTTLKLDLENNEDLIIGISWQVDADIDLSAYTSSGRAINWYTSFSSTGMTHSGDMVRLNSNGYATEYIKIKSDNKEAVSISNIVYSYENLNYEVPYKLIIAKRSSDTNIPDADNVVNFIELGDILYEIDLMSTHESEMLGVYNPETTEFILSSVRFNDYNKASAGNIVDDNYSNQTMRAINLDAKSRLKVSDVIRKIQSTDLSINIVDNMDTDTIDLRANKLDALSFIELLK